LKNYLQTLSLVIVALGLMVVVSACASAPSAPAAAVNDTAVPQVEASSTAAPQTDASTAAPQDSGNPTDAPKNSTGGAQIESYKLMQDNGSGAAGDEVKAFKPTDHVQYFDVQLTQFLNVGSTVNWVFTAVDTSAGKDIKITEVNTKVVVANHLNANLSLDKDFPTGKYKADISVDGKPLGTIEYTVAE
jgi:hypothetical protein